MIKKYYANKDNTITNAFDAGLTTRGTGSNMGASDILETFYIHGQVSNSSGLSSEKARIIIQFPIYKLTNDRAAGNIPASGSVDFYLNLYNAKHSETLPREFWLSILPIRDEWQEGYGLDMETYKDLTYDQTGSNWIMARGSTLWGADYEDSGVEGGYYWNDSSSSFSQYFEKGTEDLQVNITTLVEQWIDSAGNVLGSKDNYGVGIRLSGSYETAPRSYYNKKFFSRTSNWFFDRPTLEARWDSSTQDDRGQCYISSSLASAADNLNTIYLYNYVRGRLANIPTVEATDGQICVSIFSGTTANNGPGGSALDLVGDGTNVRPSFPTVITGSKVSTGVYKATFAYTGSSDLETIYDVWFSGSDHHSNAEFQAIQYKTGTINVKRFETDSYSDSKKYYLSVTNRVSDYYHDQTHRIRLYARPKDWSPNVYTVATTTPPSVTFESASYQIHRIVDDRVVIPYDTGSTAATKLSYDVSGNYFDLNAELLEPNYTYGVRFSIYDSDTGTYEEQPFTYKLRVLKNEY